MEDKTNWDYNNIIGTLPDLPEEIIEEILKRLPVKSLNRFRCVSKSWFSIILSPQFIKNHFNHHSANNPGIIFTKTRKPHPNPTYELKHSSVHSLFLEHKTVASKIDFPFKYPCRNDQVVVGSCNGIICLVIDQSHIYLWNPSMRTSKKLPPLYVKLIPGKCGFGFHECCGDYKVVVIRKRSHVDEIKTYIYSTNIDYWHKVKGVRPGFIRCDNLGFYASMKFHFMIKLDWDSEEKIIISVDPMSRMLGVVEEPDYGNDETENNIGVLGGCLCVFSNKSESVCDVWVMKEYNFKESWTKMFSIPHYYNILTWGNRHVKHLMLPNGEVLVVCGKRFVVYNPKDDSLRHPQITNAPNGFISATVHVESLVTL